MPPTRRGAFQFEWYNILQIFTAVYTNMCVLLTFNFWIVIFFFENVFKNEKPETISTNIKFIGKK